MLPTECPLPPPCSTGRGLRMMSWCRRRCAPRLMDQEEVQTHLVFAAVDGGLTQLVPNDEATSWRGPRQAADMWAWASGPGNPRLTTCALHFVLTIQYRLNASRIPLDAVDALRHAAPGYLHHLADFAPLRTSTIATTFGSFFASVFFATTFGSFFAGGVQSPFLMELMAMDVDGDTTGDGAAGALAVRLACRECQSGIDGNRRKRAHTCSRGRAAREDAGEEDAGEDLGLGFGLGLGLGLGLRIRIRTTLNALQ